MYPREYVFVRKFKVDNENNLMYTVARSCSHPTLPTGDKYVRVETYMSNMVIRPYTTFDEVSKNDEISLTINSNENLFSSLEFMISLPLRTTSYFTQCYMIRGWL